MSIIGITFDNQGPTATNDAVFHGKILTDGVLRGCSISYVGDQVTFSPGYIISAGRLCFLPSAEAVSVPAQLGVARIVLQTDLSQVSSEAAFEQLSLIVQTASTVSALPALIQEDINAGGLFYQQELCVLNVAGSGITSVVSQAAPSRINLPLVQIVDAAANAGTAAAVAGEGPVPLALPTMIRAGFHADSLIAADGLCGESLPETPVEGQIFFLIEEAADA